MADAQGTFANAIKDAQSLGEFINGDTEQYVTTRLDKEYPTLDEALRQLFANGGVPATPFNSFSEMESSSLQNGSIAVVMHDADASKNGFYKKSGTGFWNYLRFNPLAEINSKVGQNLIMSTSFDTINTGALQGAVVTEGGVAVLDLSEPVIDSAVGTFAYRYFIGEHLPQSVSDNSSKITLTADAFFSNAASGAGEISIEQRSHSNVTTRENATPTTSGEWQSITATTTIKPDTRFIDIKFVKRGLSEVVKFKNPVLKIDGLNYNFTPIEQRETIKKLTTNAVRTMYVSKSGSDSNSGSRNRPLLTIGKAVDSLPLGGEIFVLDGGEYREFVYINSPHHFTIKAVNNQAVNIFGSNKLELTKTANYNKIYQAPLAQKPTGMASHKGQPMIAEWGTPSLEILDEDRHPLQRGLKYRLPYTQLFEIEDLATLDNTNGGWFWQDGVIYLTATDGGNAANKRYEARARGTFAHTQGSLTLERVNIWFSNSYGFRSSGTNVVRKDCNIYGCREDGFSDNANFTLSYNDTAAGNGNDGFNMTVEGAGISGDESTNRLTAIYYNPYGHDNGDDGLSCHYRSDSTVYGGLFEYNNKGDVIHVTGSNSACYGTVSRGSTFGFCVRSNPNPSLDSERVLTTMRCVGTVSYKNDVAYAANDGAALECLDTNAFDYKTAGYDGTGGEVTAINCSYSSSQGVSKKGNVVIKDTTRLS